MNQNAIQRGWKLGRGAATGCAVAVLLCQSSFGQTIQNPSFEASSFNNAPGSIVGNSPIPGWTSTMDDYAGLNPAGGDTTYANNGTVPQGNNVAWLQYGAALSTDITGLTPGTKYKVTFRANSGNPDPGPTVANILHAAIDDVDVLVVNIYPVSASNPYMYVAFEFEATAATQKLSIVSDNFGNEALLIDDFKIAPSTRWTVAPWSSDDDSGADNSFVYTHAYSFAAPANTTIKGVPFTGAAGGNPAVAGKFTTLALGNVFNNDANNVTGGSRTLANDFVYSSSVPPGSYQTINMEGLTPGTEYVFTLYTVAFDPPSSSIRWATFSMGEDRLTLNQDQYDNDNGMTISYRYTADETGKAAFRIAPLNPANMSIHVYGFANREAVSRNVAPAFIAQPRSTIISAGIPLELAVNATGFPEPTYQWRFNGTAINGATSPTYSVAQAQAQNAGRYEVVVANSVGSVTSQVASVTVGIPMENPSFEADLFSTYPGYASDNAPITGWTLDGLAGAGLNPVEDERAPFIDNGVVPHGRQTVFLQQDRTLSQPVSGLTPGAEYYLHYYENARLGVAPGLEAKMGATVVVPAHVITQVGARNPFHEVFAAFTASSATMDLAFTKSTPQAGDSTALIDNVAIVPIPAGTVPFVVATPRSVMASVGEAATFSGQGMGSSPLSYQWLKNGQPISQATGNTISLSNVQKTDEADYALVVTNPSGSVTSIVAHLTVFESIASLYSTGVDNQRVPLAEGAVDPHYVLLTNPDTGGTEAIVEGLLPSAWLPQNSSSQWIGPKLNTVDSPVGLYTYRTTFDIGDRDPKSVVIMGRWLSDNTGREIQVNGVPIIAPLSTSFTAWADFAIYGTNVNFVAGTNTIDFSVDNETAVGYTGLRVEFTRSNIQTPAGIAPQITGQPLSRSINEGDTVTFTASATGSAPLAYQWTRNGVELAGQTGLSLTLTNATAAQAGAYRIRVTNPVGSVTSEPANLSVPYRLLPTAAFGTGVDANGQLLPAGSVDPHYILSESSDAENMGPESIVVNDGWPIQAGTWLPNGPNSKWISVRADQGTAGSGAGPYTYQTTVDLTGQDSSKVRLIGGWASDDGGTDVLLNGVSLGVPNGGFGGLTSFVITNGLTAGANTLDFQLSNGDNGPSGLRVDLKAFIEVQQVLQPSLAVTRSGDNITISWSPTAAGQKLQSRADLTTGTWQDVPNATNPYTTNASTGKMFFRIAQ